MPSDSSTVVLVKNVGDKPFVDAHSSQVYSIGAGDQAVVPIGAARLWFGDARIRNTDTRKQRDEELQRLKVRYGAYDNPEVWAENQPKIKVTTMDGDEFHTILDDPKGDLVHAANVTQSEQDRLEALIRAQARELEALRDEYRSQLRADDAGDEAEEDTPKPVASKRSAAS